MNIIYFYIYIIILIISTILFTISRCYYNIHIFDIFFYPNENDNILENKIFMASNILINFGLGVLFGMEALFLMCIKIMLFDIYLFFTEYCDIFKTAKSSNIIILIIISLTSYLLGALCKQYYPKSLYITEFQ
jgi:hypothetical protein